MKELDNLVTDQFRLTEKQKKALQRLRITTIKDLLYHFPSRYGQSAEVSSVITADTDQIVSLYGKVQKLKTGKTYRSKMAMAKGVFVDESGKIELTWFNQPYIAKMISENSTVHITGTIKERNGKKVMINPKIENIKDVPIGTGDSLFGSTDNENYLFPVYAESRGITTLWFENAIRKILSQDFFKDIKDPIPDDLLKKYKLPKLSTALIWIHRPKKKADALSARKRFSFEEIIKVQIQRQAERIRFEKSQSFLIDVKKKELDDFIKRFGFELTKSQEDSISNILKDMKSGHVMHRLLEGDVGSGKTAVAAATVYAVTTCNAKDLKVLQTAYMAPTEILAKQHFESFIKYFEYTGISVGLITGKGCYKFPSKVNPTEYTKISRSQLIKWVEAGDIPIVIGTHSLIQKSVNFKNLAYVIVDEQHRFGTKQRASLLKKDEENKPHFLSMTATPIPRTLALTLYGDLDLTVLDQMPKGRKKPITEIIHPKNRKKVYEEIKTELKNGRQAYVICPRIDDPDPDKAMSLNAKSVKSEAKNLQNNIFKEYKIGELYSKMSPSKKEEVMRDFEAKKIDILVATSVVEVGINVPNATIIIIEGAERFGLSQLHQLRGRVLRSTHQAYCYIFTDSENEKTAERLNSFVKAKNGFELAEEDLKLRGAGDLVGLKQWGVSDLMMEAFKNIKLIEATREEARKIAKDKIERNINSDLYDESVKLGQVHLE